MTDPKKGTNGGINPETGEVNEKPEKSAGLGRLAKRRIRLLTLVERKRAEGDEVMALHYEHTAQAAERRLWAEGACLRCGRRLQDETSKERGYGSECAHKLEADTPAGQRPVGLSE